MRKRALVVMLVVSLLAAVGVTFWRAVEPARLQVAAPPLATTALPPSLVVAPTTATGSAPPAPLPAEATLQAASPVRPDLAKQEALRVAGTLPSGFVATIEGRAPGGAELDRSSARFHTEARPRALPSSSP